MPDQKPDDIENVLGAMADGEHDAPEKDHETAAPDAGAPDQNVAEAEQTESDLFEGGAPASSGPRPRRRPNANAARRRGPTPLSRMAVKACMVVGMLLFIPALWAVAVLIGLDVPASHSPNADGMALLMLVCWPIALALVIGAYLYAKQIARHDAALAADEQVEPDPAAEI